MSPVGHGAKDASREKERVSAKKKGRKKGEEYDSKEITNPGESMTISQPREPSITGRRSVVRGRRVTVSTLNDRDEKHCNWLLSALLSLWTVWYWLGVLRGYLGVREARPITERRRVNRKVYMSGVFTRESGRK